MVGVDGLGSPYVGSIPESTPFRHETKVSPWHRSMYASLLLSSQQSQIQTNQPQRIANRETNRGSRVGTTL